MLDRLGSVVWWWSNTCTLMCVGLSTKLEVFFVETHVRVYLNYLHVEMISLSIMTAQLLMFV